MVLNKNLRQFFDFWVKKMIIILLNSESLVYE